MKWTLLSLVQLSAHADWGLAVHYTRRWDRAPTRAVDSDWEFSVAQGADYSCCELGLGSFICFRGWNSTAEAKQAALHWGGQLSSRSGAFIPEEVAFAEFSRPVPLCYCMLRNKRKGTDLFFQKLVLSEMSSKSWKFYLFDIFLVDRSLFVSWSSICEIMSSSNVTCYLNDGSVATENYFCGLPYKDSCCGSGWECLSNGLCQYTGTTEYAPSSCQIQATRNVCYSATMLYPESRLESDAVSRLAIAGALHAIYRNPMILTAVIPISPLHSSPIPSRWELPFSQWWIASPPLPPCPPSQSSLQLHYLPRILVHL